MLAPRPPTLAARHRVGLLLGVAAARMINEDNDNDNDDNDDGDDMLPVVVWLDGGEGLVGGVRLYGPARRALAAQHGGVVILHRLTKIFVKKYLYHLSFL